MFSANILSLYVSRGKKKLKKIFFMLPYILLKESLNGGMGERYETGI